MINLDFIYRKSPSWFKNILVSTYGYVQFKKRYSGDVNSRLRSIRKNNIRSREDIESYQLKELKKIFNYAVNNVPYYKKNYSKYIDDIKYAKSLDVLNKLPVIDKSTVKTNYNDFLSSSEKKFINQQTSGSTGGAFKFALNKKTYQLAMALLVNHESEHGITFGDRKASFNGRIIKELDDTTPPFWVYNKSENQKMFSSYHLDMRNFYSYDKELSRFKPKELIGYPSVIYELACLYESTAIKPNYNLDAIITNSETLMHWQRETIERVFQSKIYDYYGSAEYVLFASQCENFNYHIDPSIGIVEVVDDSGIKIFESEGEVVATTLVNTSMPLIRYRIGDSAVLSEEICRCGKESQFIKRVVGRLDDILITEDGRHIGRTGEVFGYFENIKEAQIIQATNKSIVLLICLLDKEKKINENAVIKKMKEKVGGKINIEIQYVEAIPRGSNGKFKTVINYCLQ